MTRTLRSGGQGDRDANTLFVPFTTLKTAFNMGNRVGFFAMTARPGTDGPELERQVKEALSRHHRIAPHDTLAIGSFNMFVMFAKFQTFFFVLWLVSWIVGGATLFAGVIGVSNIMLITVKERTKEIGVRKALGATPLSIVSMVMKESIVLTTIAGLIGVAAGVGLLAGACRDPRAPARLAARAAERRAADRPDRGRGPRRCRRARRHHARLPCRLDQADRGAPRRVIPRFVMKRIISWLFVLVLVAMIGGAFFYLWKKSQAKPVVFQTEAAEVADIIKKTVATGSIVPRREVEVKPKVTGVLAELYVEPGKIVQEGDPLGKIAIVPDAMQINQAEADVRSAQIAFDNAQRELARNEALFKQGVVADAELQRFRTEFALRKQELDAAGSSLQLVRDGATRGQGKSSTLIVTATAAGMVIDVPVKVGFSVIQANNFNPGTTVAIVADMDDMIFEGRVDEAEVAKIKEGMKLDDQGRRDREADPRGQARVHLAQGQDDRRRDPVRDQGGGRPEAGHADPRELQRERRHRARREGAGARDPRGAGPVQGRQAVRRDRDLAAELRQEGRPARPVRRDQGRGARRGDQGRQDQDPRDRRAGGSAGRRPAAREEVGPDERVVQVTAR